MIDVTPSFDQNACHEKLATRFQDQPCADDIVGGVHHPAYDQCLIQSTLAEASCHKATSMGRFDTEKVDPSSHRTQITDWLLSP
mgnify:CR=1 FL=1